MPSASPLLKALLERWSVQRAENLRSAVGLVEQGREEGRPLDEAWMEGYEAHQQEVRVLEESANRIFSRHVDHLKRLEEWKLAVSRLNLQLNPVLGAVQIERWFKRAEVCSVRMTNFLMTATVRLVQRQEEFHRRITAFNDAIDARLPDLEAFKQKATGRSLPLLVSRGRKRIDEEFAANHLAEQARLSSELRDLRRNQTRWLNRIYRASQILEHKAKTLPAHFEIQKSLLIEKMRPSQQQLFELRERILSDALVYEAARKKLRWIQDTLRGMRCVEDIYKETPSFWKRVLSHETFSLKNS